MQTELEQAKVDIVKDRLLNASECYVEPFFSKTEQFMSDVKQLLLQKYCNITI